MAESQHRFRFVVYPDTPHAELAVSRLHSVAARRFVGADLRALSLIGSLAVTEDVRTLCDSVDRSRDALLASDIRINGADPFYSALAATLNQLSQSERPIAIGALICLGAHLVLAADPGVPSLVAQTRVPDVVAHKETHSTPPPEAAPSPQAAASSAPIEPEPAPAPTRPAGNNSPLMALMGTGKPLTSN